MKKIGFCMCGSFCTHKEALEVMTNLAKEYEIVPIFSEHTAAIDTRFGTAEALTRRVTEICGCAPMTSIVEAETIASHPLDGMIICPCTGNTAAKLANGITDTSVTMAAKAHLRNDRPLVLALATNDALSANLPNIGKLKLRKCVTFVPMKQDSPVGKPHSMVAEFEKCGDVLKSVMEKET